MYDHVIYFMIVNKGRKLPDLLVNPYLQDSGFTAIKRSVVFQNCQNWKVYEKST